MIVDTSAIIAILRDEDDAAAYADALANADVRRLSAASYLECGPTIRWQRRALWCPLCGVVGVDLGTPRVPGVCRNRCATVDLAGVQTRLDPIRRRICGAGQIDLRRSARLPQCGVSSACCTLGIGTPEKDPVGRSPTHGWG